MPHVSEYEVEEKFIDRLEALGYTSAHQEHTSPA